MSDGDNLAPPAGLTPLQYVRCLEGIVRRESLRFLQQRARFAAALVRPLIWLCIFAVGLRTVVTISEMPPYGASVPYEVYIAPGLIAMIQLFNAMQSSLSLVYDREMGAMRVLLVSPFPRGYLLFAKLLAGVLLSLLQVYAFLAIAWFWGIRLPTIGYLALLPALLLCGLLLGSLGLLLSSLVRQLENFAGVMNFVIFPLFFASTALYPLSRIAEGSSTLALICAINPFTYCVELVRFALYGQLNGTALAVVGIAAAVLTVAAMRAYDTSKTQRKSRPRPAN